MKKHIKIIELIITYRNLGDEKRVKQIKNDSKFTKK